MRAIALLRLCLLATACWFAPCVADAQPQSPGADFQDLAAALTIDRGVTCLDSTELVEHVSTWLGTDRIAAPLAIEVHGSPHFARTVWFRIQRGTKTLAERRFEPAPARCADLHAAVGLAIALALKASLLDSLIGAPALTETNRPFRFEVQTLGGIAVIPGLDLGAAIGFQHTFAAHLAARLSFAALLAPRGDFQQDQGTFKTWLTIGRLDICSRLVRLESLDLSACVGVAAGALYATGEAFPMSRHALIEYVAVANALELDIKLNTSWSLTLAVDVLVPLRHTSFVVRDHAGTVTATHDLASAGALLAVGPAYHF